MPTSQSLAASQIMPGFVSPVHDAQSTFRAIMAALSHPARAHPLKHLPCSVGPMGSAACAIILTLADQDTPLWLDPILRAHQDVAPYIRFHTGAPLTDVPEDAHLAVICDVNGAPPLSAFAQGTADFPDRSTTVIYQASEFIERGLVCSGPGLATPATFSFLPAPENFAGQWRDNHNAYPLGVDVLVTAGRQLAGLPRSLRMEAI